MLSTATIGQKRTLDERLSKTTLHQFGWSPKSLPLPIEAEMKRLAAMVKRGELHPVLNHTKWAELRSEMLSAPNGVSPKFRARRVFSPPGFCTDWDGEFYYHIHPAADLEWIELKAVSQEWLLMALRRHTIPYSLEDGVVRVWGHTRPNKQPVWQ